MRLAATMLLVLSGCSCWSDNGSADGGDGPRDAAADGSDARDAARDSGLDGARDAEPDREAPGDCEEDELPVEAEPIDRNVPTRECGAGCTQVTRTARNIAEYDVKGSSLAYVAGVEGRLQGFVGWVDLARDEEWAFELAAGEKAGSSPWGAIAVEGTSIYVASFALGGVDRRTWLWRIDSARQCRKVLKELVSGDGYSAIPGGLDADAGNVVWYDMRNGNGRQDVFLLDGTTGLETQVTSNGCCVAETRIWGTTVAYTSWLRSPYSIWVLDTVAGNPHPIWEQGWEQQNAAIYGARVVFEHDHEFGSYDRDIHAVDLDTGIDFAVVDTPARQENPDVYGDLVVWDDHRNEGEPDRNIDIYGKDLVTGTEVQLTSLPGIEANARVWERTVYFQALIDSSTAVYSVPFPPGEQLVRRPPREASSRR